MDLTNIQDKLRQHKILPLQAQAHKWTQVLEQKLSLVIPQIMEKGEMWLVLCKENAEDPVFKTMVTWDFPSARRISILAFFKDETTNEVSRYILGGSSPEMNALYMNYKIGNEIVWDSLKRLLEEKKPHKINLNFGAHSGMCDGLSHTLYETLLANMDVSYHQKVQPAQHVATRWLQTVIEEEKVLLQVLTEVTHDIINLTFSKDFIKLGHTTTTDVEWEMREIIAALGFDFWFGPDVDVQRRGDKATRIFNTIIQKGDLLHCDIGLVGRFIPLHTDVQHLTYICHDHEEGVPEEIQELLITCNQFQDIVTSSFKVGITGNDVFQAAYEIAQEQGIVSMLYTHPIGTYGHGAGPSIGMYDNQGFVKGSGELKLYQDTCYALELNICKKLKMWDDQVVYAYLEEDIVFNEKVEYLAGRQTVMPFIK